MRVNWEYLTIVLLLASCSVFRNQNAIESIYIPGQGRTPINNSKELEARDSLVRIIDQASIVIPSDLKNTTLIIETYDYKDYLKFLDDKYTIHIDSRRNRKGFRYYRKHLETIHPLFGSNRIFAKKGHYDQLDVTTYRYVLRTTTRFTEVITKDSGRSTTRTFHYIFDRQTNKVFKEITDSRI